MSWATLIALVAISLATAARADTWRTVEEQWYIIEIDGARAGWVHEHVEENQTQFRTTSDQRLSISRGAAQRVDVSLTMTMIEGRDGSPVEIGVKRLLGGSPEQMRFIFEDGRIRQITHRNGDETEQEVENPTGDWFMPRAAAAFEAARRQAGAEVIAYDTIEASSGLKVVGVRMTRQGEASHEVDGRRIPVTVWQVERTVPGLPGERGPTTTRQIVHISEDDAVVYAEESMGALTWCMRISSEREATRAIAAAPEILVRTFVRPDRRIPGALRSVSARYRMTMKSGEDLTLPAAGAQRINSNDEGSAKNVLIVEVDRRHPLEATAEERENGRYLEASAMVDSDDAGIIALARTALERIGDDAAARAEALRRATHRHIARKGLSTVFASATETLQTRSGDCSEHAVLLCALLRADGIPARVATGLVYADAFAGQRNIFAWHMWTQALVDGRWIDLDATMTAPFHAAHILTGTSSLADGALSDELTRTAALLGNLEIEVLDVEYE